VIVEQGYSRPGLLPRATEHIPGRARYWLARAAISLSKRSRAETFCFDGKEYAYSFDPYNLAWRNERTVEIPIVSALLRESGGDVLEVGNVLSHYLDVRHDVVDRYEVAPSVVNVDVTSFEPGKQYQLILSVSTLEHIGWDESPRDPRKVITAVAHLRSLLAPGGRLVATVPVGLNGELDGMISRGEIPFTGLKALRRVSRHNEWVEVDVASVWGTDYRSKGYRADAIVVCRLDASEEEPA
jgi:hypothetical protein